MNGPSAADAPAARRASVAASSPAASATKTWPLVYGKRFSGCLGELQRAPLEFYRGIWREHGDFIDIRILPGFHMYLLAHPAAIEHVLHGNLKNYRKPDSFNHSVRLLAGNGILTSEGEPWRKQRRLMQPAFSRASVASIGEHMTDSLGKFVDEWNAAEDGRAIDILPEVMRLGLRIASKTLVGTDISGAADAIGRAYRTTFEYVSLKMNGRLMFQPLWLPTARNREFRREKALLDRVVLELIAQRRREAPRNDVLGRLLAAQDEDSGAGMTDEQLRDEVITLLTAGHETGGAALAWSLYLLAQHPEAQEQLYDEVKGHLGGRLPGVTDMPQLPLATAVFEESMRLYPPAWGMPRETLAEDVICGYPIPKKATVVLSQLLIHRHPDFWTEPDKFDPARFLGEAANQRAKFAFFPFGGGPRLCIGNNMAMLEGPLALATLVQNFHFTLVPNQNIVPDPTFTLRPKYGVQLVIRKRT
jgi:cytochrome P450